MSDSTKGNAFAKVVQKTIVRTKTKVLQNLGKAEKTTDGTFDDYVTNFQKQQATALKLQKEVKHYVTCVKAMTQAARNLYTVIAEVYEPEWTDPHTVDSSLKSLDLLYASYEAELTERVHSDLINYTEKFPVIKEKIHKRARKLLDYDNARHECDAAKAAKKRDESKIAKLQDAQSEAQRMYREVDSELQRDLPRFYDSRVDILAASLGGLFSAEFKFHLESGKVSETVHDLMTRLASESEQRAAACGGLPSPHNESVDPVDLSSLSVESPAGKVNGVKSAHPAPVARNSSDPSNPSSTSDSLQRVQRQISISAASAPPEPSSGSATAAPPPDPKPRVSMRDNVEDFEANSSELEDSEEAPRAAAGEIKEFSRAADELNKPMASADRVNGVRNPRSPVTDSQTYKGENNSPYENITSREPLSPKMGGLYQVQATHPYTAEDEDEISFEAGEIITVVEFDDPEEQDDGWLMGIIENTDRKGVFPENFTRRIPKQSL